MLRRTPLVGRHDLLTALTAALDAASRGRGSAHVLIGDGGIGKTRLADAVAAAAAERSFTKLIGRAYPVEQGVPYALVADAALSTIRAMPPSVLEVLSRGGVADLAALFPAWRPDGVTPISGDAGAVKARMHDTFATFLQRLAGRNPVLLIADNLHWADPSSLELLHFVARHVGKHPIVLLGTWNSAWTESVDSMVQWEQSLRSIGVLTTYDVEPLDVRECAEFLTRLCGVEASLVGDAAAWLHARTGGNPYFLEELVSALRANGRLGSDGTGWSGWSASPIELPRTIRDALRARLSRLDPNAQRVVTLAAVIGTEVPHQLLERIVEMPDEVLLNALGELRRERVLVEHSEARSLAYLFTHPLLREVLLDALPMAQRRTMHARIAEVLAADQGAAAPSIELLAVHYLLADAPSQHAVAAQTLLQAGEAALRRGAVREAVEFLDAAVRRADAGATSALQAACRDAAARAQVQRGAHQEAVALWTAARAVVEAMPDPARVAAIDRRVSDALARGGDLPGALEAQARGLAVAEIAGDDRAITALRLARASLLLDIGRGEEAEAEASEALTVAQRIDDPRLLARVHHELQMIAIYRGPRDAADGHAARAKAYAEGTDDAAVLWNITWGMAMHAGLTGDAQGTARHLAAASAIAERTRSPLHRLWTAEVEIEYRSGIGDWSGALALADETIRGARDFSQGALLPRLLVWSALVRLGRGDFAIAKEQIDEAWALAGAGDPAGTRPVAVHVVIPAHVGRAAWHLARTEYAEALRIAEAGLALADRTGYVAWAIHRLMPIAAEASLWIRDWERAAHYGTRLRETGARLGHPLALAWSDACSALSRMLQGDKAGAVAQLRAASDALDAIPFVEHGARLRRKLADAYNDSGDSASAVVELRRVHDSFDRLGAVPALTETRDKLRQLGVRPPPRRGETSGAGALTARELEIARMVAARRSNKEIAAAVDISPRTVSTHLSNIFAKLGVGSRGELTDRVRQGDLGAEDPSGRS